MRIGAIRITANTTPKIKLPINAITLDNTVYLKPSKYISMLFVNIEKSGTYSPLFLYKEEDEYSHPLTFTIYHFTSLVSAQSISHIICHTLRLLSCL